MDLHNHKRAGIRVSWLALGVAAGALCLGPGMASASGLIVTAHRGSTYHPGDGTDTNSSTNGGSNTDTGSGGNSFNTDTLNPNPPIGGGFNDFSSVDNIQQPPSNDNPPVDCPEPGTLALLLAGLGGMLFVQTRRRRGVRALEDGTR